MHKNRNAMNAHIAVKRRTPFFRTALAWGWTTADSRRSRSATLCPFKAEEVVGGRWSVASEKSIHWPLITDHWPLLSMPTGLADGLGLESALGLL
jgi:hypothetical protein